MTSLQRISVIILTLADLLVLSAIAVVGYNVFSSSREQTVIAQATAAVVPTESVPAAPTPEPSSVPNLPTPTNTLMRGLGVNVQATPPAGFEKDWKYYENARYGFGIGLPAAWRQLDVDPATFSSTLETLKQKNPDAAKILGAQSGPLLTAGFKFWGFDLKAVTPQRSFATNVNLLTEELSSFTSLDTYVIVSLAQLDRMSSIQKPITHRRLKLGGGEAEEIRYHIQLNGVQEGKITTATTQYIFLRDRNSYILTLTTTADQETNYASTFEKIGQSFRCLKP